MLQNKLSTNFIFEINLIVLQLINARSKDTLISAAFFNDLNIVLYKNYQESIRKVKWFNLFSTPCSDVLRRPR